jgi:hypothetical protein
MNHQNSREFCLIVEGNYFSEEEAKHALCDPFIEEWVEQTGSFRIHNFDDIQVAAGISLGDLAVKMLEEEVFEISSVTNGRPLNEHRAKSIAEALRRQDMFDEIEIKPLGDPA